MRIIIMLRGRVWRFCAIALPRVGYTLRRTFHGNNSNKYISRYVFKYNRTIPITIIISARVYVMGSWSSDVAMRIGAAQCSS